MINRKIIKDIVQQIVNRRQADINIEDDTPLLSSGLLSSMDMLEVIVSIENHGLKIFEDIDPDITNSVAQLAELAIEEGE